MAVTKSKYKLRGYSKINNSINESNRPKRDCTAIPWVGFSGPLVTPDTLHAALRVPHR